VYQLKRLTQQSLSTCNSTVYALLWTEKKSFKHWVIGHFTFWISLSVRLLLNPIFGLRPKISQKVKSFFVWTQRIAERFAERFAETRRPTERSLNPKLLNSPVYLTCTKQVNQLEIKFLWEKITSLIADSKKYKKISRNQRWRQRWR